MAVLTKPISNPNFDFVGKRIAEILADELENQTNNFVVGFRMPDIFYEEGRVIDHTRVPAINVRHNLGEFRDYYDAGGTQEATFWVDVYEKAENTSSENGFQAAKSRMKSLMNALWHILNSPHYRTLGYKPGTVVAGVQTTRYEFSPKEAKETVPVAQGRMYLTIDVIEESQYKDVRALEEIQTQAILEGDENGHKWITQF